MAERKFLSDAGHPSGWLAHLAVGPGCHADKQFYDLSVDG